MLLFEHKSTDNQHAAAFWSPLRTVVHKSQRKQTPAVNSSIIRPCAKPVRQVCGPVMNKGGGGGQQMTRGGMEGGWSLRWSSKREERWRQKLIDDRYESGQRKQQPGCCGPEKRKAEEKMSHTSQRALFSPSAEKTQAAKEYLFYLMITPSARHSLKQSQLHVRRQTLLPRGEKSYLHSRRPLAALFLPRSESLGRDILSETRERHSVTHPNGGFNNLKPARSSISKKAWKKGSLHAILMLLQKCRQNDKQRKRMKFLVFGFRREDAAIRGAQILLQGFNYRQVIKPVVVFLFLWRIQRACLADTELLCPSFKQQMRVQIASGERLSYLSYCNE